MNAIDNVSLGIEFINSSVNPGGEGAIPQTGDFYAISLIALFCVCLLTLSIFMLVKRKSILCGSHIKLTEVSKITKFMISPTAIVLFISIIISCGIINTTKALANINDTNNVDIKPDKISVVIDEGSDTINDAVFDFVNNSDNYYLFDKTTIMELDSEVAGLTSPNDWSIQLTALETELYNGAPDGREYEVPGNVVTLYPGQSAHATLKFNKGTAELAKKLVGKNVFNLTMIPDQQVAKAPEPKTDLVYNGSVQNAFDALETDAYSITTGSAKDAGSYTAVATLKPDYKWPDKSTDALHIEWSLSKLPAILTWDSDSIEYTGKLIHPEAIISNKIQLDEVDVSSYEIPVPYDGINAGQQEVIAKSLTGKDSNNYIINEASSKIKNYTITKKALIITADDKEKDLGDAKDPELTATFDGLVEGETFVKDEDYQLWRETGQEVVDAQFPIHVKVLDASITAKNYQITTNDGVLVIVDNKPAISPNSSSKTYGQDDPTLTAEVTKTEAEHPLVADSDFTLSRVEGEDYGQYKITVSLNEESPNVIYYKNKHGIRLNEGFFTINKYSVPITWDAFSGSYNGEVQHPTATLTKAKETDDVSIKTYAPIDDKYDLISAGTQKVIISELQGSSADNYSLDHTTNVKEYAIDKYSAKFNWSEFSGSYTGDIQYPTADIIKVKASDDVSIKTYGAFNDSYDLISAGQQKVKVTILEGTCAINYSLDDTSNANEYTIDKYKAKFNWSEFSGSYTGDIQYPTADIIKVKESDDVSIKTYSAFNDSYDLISAGQQKVKVDELEGSCISNYSLEGATNEKEYNIDKYLVPFSWSAFSGTYTGEVQHPTATLTKAKDTDTVSIKSYAAFNTSFNLISAGAQKVKVSELEGASALNYSLESSTNVNEYSIGKADIAMTVSVTGGKLTQPKNYQDVTLTGSCDITFGPEESRRSISYQWYESDTLDGQQTSITGATSNTYTIGKDSYLGQKFYFFEVVITTTDSNFKDTSKKTNDDHSVKLVYTKMNFNDQQNETTVLYTYYGTDKLFDSETGTVEKNIPSLSKEGYIMNGWFTQATSGNMVVNYNNELVKKEVSGFVSNNGTWANVEEKTLYAHFSQANYLTFTNLGSGSNTISFNFTSNNNSALEPLLLWYSTDLKEWKSYEGVSTETVELAVLDTSIKNKVYVCGSNQNGFSDENRWGTFSSTDNYKIEGSYGALIDPLGSGALTVPNDYCFQKLFKGSNKLISVPKVDISFTDEQPNCLNEMFMNCSSINYLEVGFKSWPANGFKDWVTGLAERGTFICPPELEWKCDGSKNNRGDFCPKEFNNGKGEGRFWLEQLAEASFKAHFYVGDEEHHEGYTICPLDNDSDLSPFPYDSIDTTSVVVTDTFIDWTSNIRSLNSWFSSMSKLSSLDVSKWDTSNVTNYRFTFCGMSSVAEIDISGWTFDKVNDTFTMFADCYNLEKIITNFNLDLTERLTASQSRFMFNNCSKLPNWCGTTDCTMAKLACYGGYIYASSVGYMNIDTSGHALFCAAEECPSLKNYFVVPLNAKYYYDVPWWGYNKQITEVSSTSKFNEFFVNNVKSMSCWFENAENLESVFFDDLNTMNIKALENCFFGCLKLKSLNINFDTTNLENMKETFSYCESIEEIDVSNWNISNLKVCTHAFAYCSKLSKIYCNNDTDWSKSAESTKDESMFLGCLALPGYSDLKANDLTMAKPTTKGGYFTIKTSNNSSSFDDNNIDHEQENFITADSYNREQDAIKPEDEYLMSDTVNHMRCKCYGLSI